MNQGLSSPDSLAMVELQKQVSELFAQVDTHTPEADPYDDES